MIDIVKLDLETFIKFEKELNRYLGNSPSEDIIYEAFSESLVKYILLMTEERLLMGVSSTSVANANFHVGFLMGQMVKERDMNNKLMVD